MSGQRFQGYSEHPSRKRPSPALAPDDGYDVPNDLMHRLEGHKFPKLNHDEVTDTSFDFRHKSSYSDSIESLYLSDCDASESLSSKLVPAGSEDNHARSSDKEEMMDISQRQQGPTCCFGMVREKSIVGCSNMLKYVDHRRSPKHQI